MVAQTKVKYINRINDVPYLSQDEVAELEKVTRKYPFGANTYYLGLINWQDKNDPIRRLIIPSPEELEETTWGAVDPSHEADYTVTPGLQHKYPDTALLLLCDFCGGRCRYCFRKRLFFENRSSELLKDYRLAYDYIRNHSEINNVLLTGGDPLFLKTGALREVLANLRQIDHVGIIRIGTRLPVFDPFRIIGDPELPDLIKEFSKPEKRLYFMVHFSHPREITPEATRAVDILLSSGAILCNQNPLIKGINDDPETLAELWRKLSFMGVTPYYIFQDRPAIGNKPYAVPVVKAFQIIQEAKKQLSGTAKRAVFAMSHATGKIETIGLDDTYVYMRYHRCHITENTGKLIIVRRNDSGYWFDDFERVTEPVKFICRN
jgi:lysine 2,3-aminomutase